MGENEMNQALASFRKQPGILLLECGVQHYAWGDTEFLPELLGIDNSEKKPYAELWMGAHPDLPSKARLGETEIGLDLLLSEAAEEILGAEVACRFTGLPFLLKVLSAAQPLSIQVHPTPERAKEGFARENAAGIPPTAGNRNYKDENHKPELLVALTDFYGLRGFRPLSDIARTLVDVPELGGLMPDFQPDPACLESLYGQIMNLPQKDVDSLLDPLVRRLTGENAKEPFTRGHREYWLLRADGEFSRNGHRDRGLLSIYLLNLLHLEPGDGMFLPSGVLHAYLEGAGMEIMASSNNVLRGGLTPKHVDVPELLANVVFEGGSAEILHGDPMDGNREWVYKTPTAEFELRRVEVSDTQPYHGGPDHGAEILVLIESNRDSEVTLAAGAQILRLRRGQACLIPCGADYMIRSANKTKLFKATVPTPSEAAPQFRGRRPTALRFGTSGLRGLVTDITDLEAYINSRGFLDTLFQIGDAQSGDTVCIAGDLRPSTDSSDRSIMRAVARAIEDAGLKVENLGRVPTPALAYYALRTGRPSVMVTGSHIPFDRNGIKFNKTSGEILKEDEPAILEAVARVRMREYGRPANESLFDDDGTFRKGSSGPLPPVQEEARRAYLHRYLDFFPSRSLEGKRVVFFQHSAVGRDLLVELLSELGAEVHSAGRSDSFIAIDTEDITEERLADLQRMIDEVSRREGPVDALVSTDGDSDRPLLVGVDPQGRARFFGGDLLGIVVAEYLGADCITVPISTNDAVDYQLAKRGITATKTGIGSPYVIKVMQESISEGQGAVAVGWEANGGFLIGSAVERNGRKLEALPTRDAALPLIAALHASVEKDCSLVELFSQLPPRFSRAGLLDPFPRPSGHALVRRFSPEDDQVQQVDFEGGAVAFSYKDGRSAPASGAAADNQRQIQSSLRGFFSAGLGFGEVIRLNVIDGLRIYFSNGDIAHIRPSGNAPQLRIYTVADSQERADEIVKMGIREPDGLLRRLEAACKEGM